MVRDLNTDFTVNNADPDKDKYSSYGIGFDSRSEFSLTDGSMSKHFIIFGVDMSSFVHIDNKNIFINYYCIIDNC